MDEFTEKRSRFIGRIFPASTQDEAVSRIGEVKERHRDATHNVYAYIIKDGQFMRYSDDGEPQGTGGLPVLEVLRREGVADVCCVVTRYFGGTLLGAGGLVRAYARAAKIALDAAGISVMGEYALLSFRCGYDRFEQVKRLCGEWDCGIGDIGYGADVSVTASIEAAKADAFIAKMTDHTAGQVVPEVMDHIYQKKKL